MLTTLPCRAARTVAAALTWALLLVAITATRIVCHTLNHDDGRRIYLLSVLTGAPLGWTHLPAIVRHAARGAEPERA